MLSLNDVDGYYVYYMLHTQGVNVMILNDVDGDCVYDMLHTLHINLYKYIQLPNFILFKCTHNNVSLYGCCGSGPGVGQGTHHGNS